MPHHTIEAVERLEAAYNNRDYAVVDAVLADEFVAHTPGSDTVPAGREGPRWP